MSTTKLRRAVLVGEAARRACSPMQIPLLGLRFTPIGMCEAGHGCLIAAAWTRSSLGHLANPYHFLSSIYQYQLTNGAVGLCVAMLLPHTELILAVCLFGRVCVAGALLLSAALFAAFSLAQYLAISHGLSIHCGCFAPWDGRAISTRSIAYTLALAVAALLAYAFRMLIEQRRLEAQ